jgi:sn-glycerol 3-phosphate transport system substrate-binding protein
MCAPEQAADWATRTGYMPVTEDAVARLEKAGWYTQHPNDRVAYDQLAYAQPLPWAPGLFRVQRDIVQPALEDAVLANRDAHIVLTDARAEAQREAG